jgi:serine/threonine-protein kinase RsbT
MNTLKSETLPLQSDKDILIVRQTVREWMIAENFSILDQTKMVTAASELARNAIIHGAGGSAQLELLTDANRLGIRATFIDHGKGLTDLEKIMKGGYSTGEGLGLGLSGSKRLVDQFEIWSEPGKGTRVIITRWK